MTQFKENLSVKSIIKPGQSDSIHDHRWSDFNISAEFEEGRITLHTDNEAPKIYLRDAEIIAKHFNIIPFNADVDYTGQTLVNKIIPGKAAKEYLNGELVEVVADEDLRIGGFMSEDRNDD